MELQIQRLQHGDISMLKACFGVFSHLRPHLNEDSFVVRVTQQQKEGYNIVYLQQQGEVVAAAGFRMCHFLAWGKVLYIDDLITHPEAKRRGFGGSILTWLIEEAERTGCDEVHLDSGYHRHDAHRLYLKKGFKLASHHLCLQVSAKA